MTEELTFTPGPVPKLVYRDRVYGDTRMVGVCGEPGCSEELFYRGVGSVPVWCTSHRKKWQRASWATEGNPERMMSLYRNKYGLTEDQILTLDFTHCEVCGKPPGKNSLSVDHDHITNAFRGVLCHGCNTTLGNVHDNPDLLRALANYLERGDI